MAPPAETQRVQPSTATQRCNPPVIEDRHGLRSTIVTSQLPVDTWHAVIGDPTLADAILDRLVHRASIFELNVDSYRRRTAIENKRKQRPRPDLADTASDQADASPHDT